MATSAFKSTTQRASIGGSTTEDSGGASRSLRRSRSLSRFSRPIEPQLDDTPDYNRNAPRGKFVNTTRGSETQFREISLDDLSLEFFSSSSSRNENGSDGGLGEKEREGRSVSRRGGIGRWAGDTASSRRKGRSVSRTRGDVVSSNSASGAKNVSSSDAGSRRRRSLSVVPYQISDSESEVNHFRNSRNYVTAKAPIRGNGQMPVAQKATASKNRRLGRTQSHKDLSMLNDGYSSHSSALTDDESKDPHISKNGFEKTSCAIYAQKAKHPTVDAENGGLYEAMRQELRYAVEEIRTELNQAMCRNQTTLTSGLSLQSDDSGTSQDFSENRENYSTKLEQSEKRKQDILTEMLLEEERGWGFSRMVKELPDSRTSAVVKPSRARKRSSDRHRMSKRLTDEAEKYFEEFISNVEDTDISSFDGERSDGSSTLGGTRKPRYSTIREAETYKGSARLASGAGEMDGVILPWLQWDTGHDGSFAANASAQQTPVTSEAPELDTKKDMVTLSNHSTSSHDCWSLGLFVSPDSREAACQTRQLSNDGTSCYDLEDYLKLGNNEELLFEIYREQNRINLGGLLLCSGFLY